MSNDRDIEGVLRDHYQACNECDGHGHVIDEPLSGKADVCYICDGDGNNRWGSWYTADTCECEECHKEKQCGCMAEADGIGWYVCFDCYVAKHAKICGCNLWKKWEVKK